jgi:hypothetical protein
VPIVIPLIDLGTLLVLVGALIFIYLCTYIAKALFGLAGGVLGKLPVVGGWIDSGLHTVEHKIVSVMATAAQGVDSAMGFTLHETARLIDWTGREIAAHANLIHMIAAATPGLGFVVALHDQTAALHRLFHGLTRSQTALFPALIRPIYGELKVLERWTYPKVRALDHAIDVTIPRDIAGLRSRTKTIEGELGKLWDLLRKNEAALAATAFAGAVALALERLGSSWIRCRNWNRIGREVCSTPFGDIEGILGLLATGAVIADFRELVKLAQSVEHGVAVTLQDVAKL